MSNISEYDDNKQEKKNLTTTPGLKGRKFLVTNDLTDNKYIPKFISGKFLKIY